MKIRSLLMTFVPTLVAAFTEKFFFPYSIDTIFHDNRLWKNLEKKKDYKKIVHSEYFIHMSYKERFMGYTYESKYNILKYDNNIEICYKNRFLENNITITPEDENFVTVRVETKTLTPIPSHVLDKVVRKKLQNLIAL